MIRYSLVLMLFGLSLMSKGESPIETKEFPLGLTIRLVPSFFYDTYGLEVEYPLSRRHSLGLNTLYYTGSGVSKSESSTGQGAYAKSGYLAELQYKFYFMGVAPVGLYGMAAVGYNSIAYPDGSTRPFVLFNSWESQYDIDEYNNSLPDPIVGSIGIGYQIIMIQPHISGNVVLGAQFQSGDSGLLTSVFISPSLGWMF